MGSVKPFVVIRRAEPRGVGARGGQVSALRSPASGMTLACGADVRCGWTYVCIDGLENKNKNKKPGLSCSGARLAESG